MLNTPSAAIAAASSSDRTADPADRRMLTRLLVAASATLESDLAAAKACLQQATEILHGRRTAHAQHVPRSWVVTGGLASWQERRIEEYVEANIGAHIRVVDLAQVVRLSVGHFFRAFRQSFGESPLVYVARRRIRHSQSLILRSAAPLSQIALECGMSDQAHFTRVFRRVVGMNPGAWRRQFADSDGGCVSGGRSEVNARILPAR
jgi:AraC family transcriptional regulator